MEAVQVLVESLIGDGKVYTKGQIVFDPSDSLIRCAEDRRTNDAGELLCRPLTQSEALAAAKKYDKGEGIFEPIAEVPTPDDEDEDTDDEGGQGDTDDTGAGSADEGEAGDDSDEDESDESDEDSDDDDTEDDEEYTEEELLEFTVPELQKMAGEDFGVDPIPTKKQDIVDAILKAQAEAGAE